MEYVLEYFKGKGITFDKKKEKHSITVMKFINGLHDTKYFLEYTK